MRNSIHKKQSSLAQVYSFDVFDTCVTRCWIQPTDLFEGLFLALLAKQNLPSQQRETAAKALARSRIQAERTARKQTTADDITLDAIYQTLAPQLKAYNIAPAQALTEEIKQELNAVSPILSTRRYIQQLREQSHKILFISDMYLPGTVVRKMLIDQGFTDGNDDVFVSADIGLSKGTGKLFSAVCKQLNIEPGQLHHTGDNRYADVHSARRMGVKATYFAQGAPTRYEQGFRPELIGHDWVRSQIIGNSRAVRLRHATADNRQRQHAMLAANLLAPLLTGYVAWVLTTAREMRIERLYFNDKARDDGGLLAIAKAIHQQWCKHEEKQSIHHQAGRSPLPICDSVTNAPTQTHQKNRANEQHEKETPWATVGLIELAFKLPSQKPSSQQPSSQKPPSQPEPPTTKRQNTNTGYHFRLFSTIEQTQKHSAGASDYYELPYIEASIAPHKRPEGTAYLFQYRLLLQPLIATINSSDLPTSLQACSLTYSLQTYRAIVLDYAATLATSSIIHPNNVLALDMLKRYAIGNIIRFLETPTRAEVQTLIDIQKRVVLPALAMGRQPTTTMAQPILPQEIPLLLKRFVKGTNTTTINRWLEGSLIISSWPLQQMFHRVRSLHGLIIRYRTRK